MASTALSPNSAAHDSPAGLCFGSNTNQEKTCQVCLKDFFFFSDPCVPFSCCPDPNILEGTSMSLPFILAFRECRLSQLEKSEDALLRPEGPRLRSGSS